MISSPSLKYALRSTNSNPLVNKTNLSTRETREFAGENMGFGLNPGVALATRQDFSSNWRETAKRKTYAMLWIREK
jgi:hypothetical protein